MITTNTKNQQKKITDVLLILKSKFNTLIKEGQYQQAVGLDMAIEVLQEYYNKELKTYAEETTNRKND